MIMDTETLRRHAKRAAALLRALSNENRMLLLCQLVEGEKTVKHLCELVGISQSAMSQHLARLRRDGLVTPSRDRQSVYYAVAGTDVMAILETLHAIYCQPRPEAKISAMARIQPRFRRPTRQSLKLADANKSTLS